MGKRFGIGISWVLAVAGAPSRAEDCNRNGIEDRMDLAPTPTGFEPGFAVPPGTLALAAGDIDLDGDNDVVVAGASESRMWALENMGGRLSPRQAFPLEVHADRILLADLNADGRLDLVSSIRAGPLALGAFLRLPGGAFRPLSVSGVLAESASSVAVEDLDGDGDMDLALGLAQPGPRLVLFRNSGEALSAEAFLHMGPVLDIALADLDGDGDRDVAVAAPFHAKTLRLDDGLTAGDPVDIPVGASPRSIRAGDLDGDGDVDLLTANEVNPASISVISNAGDGAFAPPRNYAMGSDLRDLELSDVDGDGDLDTVCVQAFPSSGSSGVLVGFNDGSGRFADVRDLPFPGFLGDMVMTDLGDDGWSDFCILDDQTSAVFILENEGGRGFHWSPPPLRRPEVFSTAGPIHGIACTDIDADGDTDVAFARPGGLPGVLLNHGARRLSREEGFHLDFLLATRIITADLDKQLGKDLVLAAFGRREIALGLHKGGLDFEIERRVLEENPSCLGAGDLDRDGHIDVVVGGYVPPGSQASCTVLLNDGRGGVRAALAFPTGAQPLALRVDDLDGDGAQDVVLASSGANAAVVHWGKGDGSLEPPRSFATARGPAGLAGGDFDGDGLSDFAVACSAANAIHLFRNEGGRSFENLRIATMPFVEVRALAAADLDSDGLQDLVASDSWGGGTSLFRWRDGKLASLIDTFIPGPTLAVEPADVDGDGATDLVFALRDTAASISVSWNEADPPVSADHDRDGIPDECRLDTPYRRGDANGEGAVDLSDSLAILRSLFLGDSAPACLDAADADGDGRLSVADAVFLLLHLFHGGPPPAPPGPAGCGRDPHPPGSPRRLGCEAYEGCG